MKCLQNTAVISPFTISSSSKVSKISKMAIPNALQYVCIHYIYRLGKTENPAYEMAYFVTSVYSYSEQYIHFCSLWRQRLLCDIHIHICSKTVSLYYIQLELYTVLHSTSHFRLQQIEFWVFSICH